MFEYVRKRERERKKKKKIHQFNESANILIDTVEQYKLCTWMCECLLVQIGQPNEHRQHWDWIIIIIIIIIMMN